MKLAIIIPAYNEEATIAQVLSGLPKRLQNISEITTIVVDDGSSDNTGAIAESCSNVIIIRHLINRGQGAALKTGFDYVLKEGYDLAVTFDADGQHSSEEIATIIAPIVANEVEAVLGSRFLEKNAINIKWMRKLVLKGGIIFTQIFSHIQVSDTHNGFRAFHRNALKKLMLVQDKMEHASEILDLISANKISFKEVPVTINYSEYSLKKGQGHSNAIKIVLKMLLYKIAK